MPGSLHSTLVGNRRNICRLFREESGYESFATHINSWRDALQSFTSFYGLGTVVTVFVCGKYFRAISICSGYSGAFQTRNEVSDSTKQISVVHRGFDNAGTYAILCKTLRRSLWFHPGNNKFSQFGFRYRNDASCNAPHCDGKCCARGRLNLLSPWRRFLRGGIRKYPQGEIERHNELGTLTCSFFPSACRPALSRRDTHIPRLSRLFIFRCYIDIRQADKSILFERFMLCVREHQGIFSKKKMSLLSVRRIANSCLRHYLRWSEFRDMKNDRISEQDTFEYVLQFLLKDIRVSCVYCRIQYGA